MDSIESRVVGFGLYPFQERVCSLLREGKPVVLHAPTGSGKTRASLYPYFRAWECEEPFPRQAIYSVPMRVLANQFYAEYRAWRENGGFRRSPLVTLQTGEHPEDPELRGDLVFTTIDQTLSNVLGVPYSVGLARANLNAGAVLSSYLVFDEFHLFPVGSPAKAEGALVTTLQVLRALQGLVPYVLMTATFSRRLLDELCVLLKAEKVEVSKEELAQIPSQKGKARRFFAMDGYLTAQSVLERHNYRTIAVCNTVDRAIDLYENLVAAGCRPVPFPGRQTVEEVYDAMQAQAGWETATWVMLLHSRFEQRHRSLKERLLLREFGKDPSVRGIPRMILVATQVVEVGLDITSQALHTDLAPASAIIQRAGRCARFPEEEGEVYVYELPPAEHEQHQYAPYLGIEADLCRKAREAFQKRNGLVLDFSAEQEVIDEVHGEADQLLLEAIWRREGELWQQIFRSMGLGDLAQRKNLIRRVDSRIILVHHAPEALGNPYRCRGFSLWQGSLRGKWRQLEAWGTEKGLPWALQYPVESDVSGDSGEEPPSYVWRPVREAGDLNGHVVFVVHPSLVSYDAEKGLRFTLDGGGYSSQPMPREAVLRPEFVYHFEDYQQHVGGMFGVYQEELANQLRYVSPMLERRLGLPQGILERAVRLVLALHDVGKMDEVWQRWARTYQAAIGEPVDEEDRMIVHTHLETEEHRNAEKKIRIRRPPHAAEGAVAVAGVLNQGLFAHQELRRAAMTAIARHHNTGVSSFGTYRLHPAAQRCVRAALEAVGVPGDEAAGLSGKLIVTPPETNLTNHLLRLPPEDPFEAWIAYFLIVRMLRLADGRSQERGMGNGRQEE